MWNPAQYLRFRAERHRPGLDLLARIPLDDPRSIYDLGCGAGSLTVVLRQRWPQARIIGVDSSAAMLHQARALDEHIEWREEDLGTWKSDGPADLIYSNAALHWLDGHRELFPRLLRELAPRGVLAVQMPGNFTAPTHTAVADVVREGPWRARLEPLLREHPVLEAREYHALLESVSTRIDVWETVYYHALEGNDPVVEWSKGSVLRPLLDALEESAREPFLSAYGAKMRDAYPKGDDGKTLLPFKRLFVIAQKG